MKCEINNTNSMSEYCLNGWQNKSSNYDFSEDCVPEIKKNHQLFIFSMFWTCSNGIIGLVGNFLTLVSIPYAAKTKR